LQAATAQRVCSQVQQRAKQLPTGTNLQKVIDDTNEKFPETGSAAPQ